MSIRNASIFSLFLVLLTGFGLKFIFFSAIRVDYRGPGHYGKDSFIPGGS